MEELRKRIERFAIPKEESLNGMIRMSPIMQITCFVPFSDLDHQFCSVKKTVDEFEPQLSKFVDIFVSPFESEWTENAPNYDTLQSLYDSILLEKKGCQKEV